MSGFSSDETEEIPLPVFSTAAVTSPAEQTVKVEFGASLARRLGPHQEPGSLRDLSPRAHL